MHERWDDFLHYPRHWTPRASHRKRDFGNIEPARTLGEARARHIWIWVGCPGRGCTMILSVPLAPLIIRWGADIQLVDVMRRARCTRCGRIGLEMREPCWDGGDKRCVNEIHRWTGEPNSGPRFGVPEMK